MKLSEVVKVRTSKKFKCRVCGKKLPLYEIGMIEDCICICKGCKPIVEKREQELILVYTNIIGRCPTTYNLEVMKKMAIERRC